MLNNLLQRHLKLLQKEQHKKTAEATGDLIGNNDDTKNTKMMIQSGGLAHNLINALLDPSKMFSEIINKADDFSKKVTLNDIIKATSDSKFIFNALKHSLKNLDAGITLTDNEMKDITKVIKSLENRGILLKGTTKKISSQEGGFLNFLRPLMTAGLPLMKSVLIPLAKNVLLPLGLSAGMSAADATIQKKNMDQEQQH